MGSSKYAVDFDLSTVQGRLYYARVAHRLSRAVVAKAYGGRARTIKTWERCESGTTSVPYEYVQFATVAYGVPESWLLGETHDLPLSPPAPRTEMERLMTCMEACPEVLLQRRLKGGWRRLARAKKSSP